MKLILFFSLLISIHIQAQDYETVIEATVFNSSSKVVLDEKTIRESKAPDLISLITTQANINLFNNNFQPPQLFMRGGDSNHILFMIDGAPVFDTSWSQRTLNLNSLDIGNVKRIEILKGGQTVLYGGQALVGVIKIETFGSELQNKKQMVLTGSLPDGNKKGLSDRRLGLSSEIIITEGSALSVSGRTMERKNESPVLHSNRFYDQINHNIDLGYLKTDGPVYTQLRGFWFKDKSRNPTTVNNMGQQSIADSDVQRQDEQTGASASLKFKDIMFQPQLVLFGQKGWRFFYSNPTSADVDAKFQSGLQGAQLNLLLLDRDLIKIHSGLSYQKEDFFLDDSTATLSVTPRTADRYDEIRGAYVHTQILPNRNVLFEAGTRVEKVTGFAEQNSYQLGLTLFQNTKLEWVTGYRAPSSAQRFGIFQSVDLEPETSQTYSVTQDFKVSSQGEFSVTLFETSFSNYIETKSLGGGLLQYQNTARVKTKGAETAGSYAIDNNHTLQMSYAYQEPWDQVRHEKLRRRPNVSGTLRWLYSSDQWGGSLEGTGTGERNDFFGASRYTYPGYFLVNSSLRYKMDVLNTFSLRVSNWFDVRPEISIDFYSEGRNMLVSWERNF